MLASVPSFPRPRAGGSTVGICRPSCPLPAQHEAGHPARMATAAPGRARRLPARGAAGGKGGGQQVLVRGARSSFIHRVPNGARNRSGPLSPPAAQDVAPRARSPAGTADAAAAAGLSRAQLASAVTRGRGWQRALRGSRPAPARRRLGALRESRGSPDLPKVAGTSIRRARAHGNRPGRASARLAAGPGPGAAAPRAVTLQKTGGAGGWHPGEPPPIPLLQHAALGPGTQPLRILCCLVPFSPFPGRLLDLLGSAYLVPPNSGLPGCLGGSRDTRNRGRICSCSSVCWGVLQPARPPVPSSANDRS